jgi:biotin carboxylase
MDPMPRAGSRPRLAVVYGHRSLELTQIRGGARDWCDLVWLIDAGDPAAARARPLLRRYGEVVDALGAPPAAAADALRPHAPQGLATFYDTGMERVAEIARELELPFHSAATARRLEDKLAQREALRAAGLPTPAAVALPADADRATAERLGSAIAYPAVLKPRRESGSWHTFPIADVRALGDLWDELAPNRLPMLLEEYLPDGPPLPGGFEADYVSVETVVAAGRMSHLAITGRFPPAPPFRETGFFIPATLSPEQEVEVLALAGATLRALGVEVGAAHTEIKLTPDGPRVIEVNGRVGGGVPNMLALTTGLDIVELSMRAALGLDDELPRELPRARGVGYRFFYQPPASARRVTELDGIDRLRRHPGVESVQLHLPPGSEIDARHGTRTYLFAVVGAAPDYAGMLAVHEFLQREIGARYDHS